MAVLPTGFALPPLPYLVVLVVGVLVVVRTLWALAPPVTAGTVLGLAPWIGVGAAFHALYVLDVAPPVVAPLFGTPAVYPTVFIGIGALWVAGQVHLGDTRAVAVLLGLSGVTVLLPSLVAVLASGRGVEPIWPTLGLLVGTATAGGTWHLVRRVRPDATAATGWPGALVVFAHALDGVSTAIGVDVLGFGERTPLSRAVMDLAAALPTAELLGVGWLFALVKLIVAALVVVLFADLVAEEPRQGHLLLAVVAAVGLGPAVHNLLLYAVVP